jgi:RNA polymerase sigma factor (sigma-70 family)
MKASFARHAQKHRHRGTLPMPLSTPSSVARQIETLFDGGSVAGLTDQELIERFNARRDATSEIAFAALVSRHGPMVLDICHQLLGNPHDAEDAFQAVFLVLARKARSIGDSNLLANWLYGVALRTARNARIQRARRRDKEEAAMTRHSRSDPYLLIDHSDSTPEQSVLAREQAEALFNEIDRLPGPFRLPVVLCYFEGLTLEEAAHRLRCPAGTVRSRLSRAYDKLRRGLARRGVVLPAAGIGAALASRTASACVSSALCETTARAAMIFAAGRAAAGAISAAAVALAHDVLRSMLLNKLKLAVLTLFILGAAVAGAGSVAQVPAGQAVKPDLRPIAKTDDANAKPGPGRMFVVGRVLDPVGKPVPDAAIMVHARSTSQWSSGFHPSNRPVPIGDARADRSGRFHLEAPRTSSSRYDTFGVVAIAPGYGVGWAELDPDADQPAADVTLRPEHIIQGRLFDVQGRPAQGVTISVSAVRPPPPKVPSRALAPAFLTQGPAFWWTNAHDYPAWPKPVTSDAQGRFTLRGVGRSQHVSLTVRDQRFALHSFEVETDGAAASQPLRLALEPAKIITGRVTYSDTGKPVPHLPLIVEARGRGVMHFEADGEGRFRMNPPANDHYSVAAWPAADHAPYLSFTRQFDWPKGAVEHSLDLALPRGILVHGRVTEEGSGLPIAGAAVRLMAPLQVDNGSRSQSTSLNTAADGSFQFGALPRLGYLLIMAPSDDYVLQTVHDRMLASGQPGAIRAYSHAGISLDLKPGDSSKEVHVTLRRGVTVKGRVVGPDRQPVVDAWMLSRIHNKPSSFPSREWRGDDHGIARHGRFELHGLDRDVEVPVSFFEPKSKLGATAGLSGRMAGGEPVVVKLEPCGTATARLVGPGGKPLAGFQSSALISMVVTPGALSRVEALKDGTMLADEGFLTDVDPINYPKAPAADAQGRIVFPALIPGASYRLSDGRRIPSNGPQLHEVFTLKPGETRDLGDILIEKPAAQ